MVLQFNLLQTLPDDIDSLMLTRLLQGIIEGDQIVVAAFYLESFAYLTGLVTANHNAGSNSARARRLIQI